MAVEAPLAKYKKNNLKIFMVFLIGFAMWCVYDGYFNDRFKEQHTSPDGIADSKLAFNRQAPFYLLAVAAVLGGYFVLVKDKKIVADEEGIVLSSGTRIAYNSIEKVNKTYFATKGYFIVTYKDSAGKEINHKLSNRRYDNLSAVLDVLVEKIS